MVDAKPRRIPEATVIRLPVYQRILAELVRAGTATVASEQLAEMARVNASKVRKDLSFLGSFGTRGSGYDTSFLLSQIDRELGIDGDWPVAVVGLGNLGRALANSQGFTSRGFRVCSLFDVEPSLVGSRIQGLPVHHLDDFETVAADRMIAAGVGSLLNFAPKVLTVPPTVLLRYVDLSIELQVMSFYLSHRDQPGTTDEWSPLSLAVGINPAPPA